MLHDQGAVHFCEFRAIIRFHLQVVTFNEERQLIVLLSILLGEPHGHQPYYSSVSSDTSNYESMTFIFKNASNFLCTCRCCRRIHTQGRMEHCITIATPLPHPRFDLDTATPHSPLSLLLAAVSPKQHCASAWKSPCHAMTWSKQSPSHRTRSGQG